MVVFDASVLLLILDAAAQPPNNPKTGSSVERATDRIDYLVQQLSNEGENILIPTPALSEVLVHAGEATQRYIEILNRESCFRIAPFDQKAAIEAAVATKEAIQRGGKRIDAHPGATAAKIKFDRQIVAIAKVEGARAVYSDDDDVIRYARAAGLKAYRTTDLPLPPEDPQQHLPLKDE